MSHWLLRSVFVIPFITLIASSCSSGEPASGENIGKVEQGLGGFGGAGGLAGAGGAAPKSCITDGDCIGLDNDDCTLERCVQESLGKICKSQRIDGCCTDVKQ